MTSEHKPCWPGCVPSFGLHDLGCLNAPKPAEPPKCDCWKHENQVCDICQGVEAEPQGEPPIDFEAASVFARDCMPINGGPCFSGGAENLARAYLHLAAEVAQEKLFRRADIEQRDKFRAALDSKDAECVALAAEVERLRGEILQECAEAICIYCAARLPEWAAAPKPNALGRWFHPLNDTHRGPDALCLAEAIHAKKEARNDR